jgi:hypothetical protein
VGTESLCHTTDASSSPAPESARQFITSTTCHELLHPITLPMLARHLDIGRGKRLAGCVLTTEDLVAVILQRTGHDVVKPIRDLP